MISKSYYNCVLVLFNAILISCCLGVRDKDVTGKILGGTYLTIYDHPYQVALQHRNPSGVFGLACGGVLVRQDVVLTAAQCVIGTAANRWRAKAGSTYHIGDFGEFRIAKSLLTHPNYVGFPQMLNDIAIMHLTSEFTLSAQIKLIRMPYQDQELAAGTKANFTGWGSTFEGGPSSETLKKITVPVVDHNRCHRAYHGFVNITQTMICAGVVGVGDQDFCQRDTGGPLAVNNFLWGLASFGYSCGNPNYPGVYTKVSKYMNWINANV